jgi:hypothetical protein
MTLRVVGAGVGRTGTLSLKTALEELLGGRCYHMLETFGRPDDLPVWEAAVLGEPPDWREFLADFDAAVDWPASAFWRELADAFPDAIVLLSTRSSTDAWWTSATSTIFERMREGFDRMQEGRPDEDDPMAAVHQAQRSMVRAMLAQRFTADVQDEAAAKAAYEAHNATVRTAIPPARLVEWQPGDGWEPICAALGLEVPDTPFPQMNSTDEFRAMVGLDPL